MEGKEEDVCQMIRMGVNVGFVIEMGNDTYLLRVRRTVLFSGQK
jgi:hypothetical protein